MFVVLRAVTYATLFIGLLLIYLPARLLSWSGIESPDSFGVQQVAGMALGSAGAVVALWCIVVFAAKGKGTPAPFDPPRRLVAQGPLPLRAESHVHWRRLGSRRRGALLRVAVDSGLCGGLLSRHPSLRRVVRGARSAASLRAGVLSVLPPRETVVAGRLEARREDRRPGDRRRAVPAVTPRPTSAIADLAVRGEGSVNAESQKAGALTRASRNAAPFDDAIATVARRRARWLRSPCARPVGHRRLAWEQQRQGSQEQGKRCDEESPSHKPS